MLQLLANGSIFCKTHSKKRDGERLLALVVSVQDSGDQLKELALSLPEIKWLISAAPSHTNRLFKQYATLLTNK